MWTSAKISRICLSFLLLNLVLVVSVAVLRPVFAQQTVDEPAPEIQIPPTDPPSLPVQPSAGTSELAIPSIPDAGSSADSPLSGPTGRMVMDEMRKLIQEGRPELEVPPLTYPSLPLKAGVDSAVTDLQHLSQRMKSIAQLTQSGQALIAEAQHLKAAGNNAAARSLTEHVQTLKLIIVQLAKEDAEAIKP